MFNENKDFYPTKKELVFKMLNKLGKEGLYDCKYILEPEAGKGDIIKAYSEYYLNERNKYKSKWDKPLTTVDKYLKFDCIELDKNLNSLLRGQDYNVIWDDYLTFTPTRFYDLIIQNVPFSNGAKHLLKSISIQERMGGKILCIINAETIKNPYSKERIELINKLNQYNANIEYIENAFTDAERKTDVEIAMIYLDIPMLNTETLFEKEFKRDKVDININSNYTFNQLIPKMNKLEHLVFEYNIVRDSVIKLFEEKARIGHLFKDLNISQKIGIIDSDEYQRSPLAANEYINKITLEYWNKFITETDFKSKLPSKLRDNFSYNMERQQDIPFTIENCRYFYEKIMNNIPKSYEKTIADVFDTLTSKYSYTEASWNKNIHMYTGWKTNKICKIVGKNIIPCHLQNGGYSLPDVLIDLNVIFNNLSGTKYIIDTQEIREKIKNCEKGIDTEYFILDSYKKGTLHIKYKDQELLKRFNYLACKGHNVLPPDFGKKKYKDMTEEEKELVKFFNFKPVEYDNIVLTGNTNYIPLQLN